MKKVIKLLFLLLLVMGVIAESGYIAQALRFARGGQQDTYYDIRACTDGMVFTVGLNVPDAPTTPKARFARVDYMSDMIMDGETFALDGPSNVTIYDGASNNSILLSHTGTLTGTWRGGAGLPTIQPGMRVRIVVPAITNAGQDIGVADSFYSIVQPCSIQNPPPDRENRVFYPPGGNEQNPGSRVPDTSIPPYSVITSTIPVNSGAGKIVADVNVGMHIENVVPGHVKAYLISPAGTRVKLFENLASKDLGIREMGLDNGLVRDLMPDFVLDDDSVFVADPNIVSYRDADALRPIEALTQLNGEDPNGDWLLEIHNDGSVNQQSCESRSGTPNLTIPDGNMDGVAVYPAFLATEWVVTDVNVTLDITHTWVGDLSAFLFNPSRTQASALVHLVGGNGQNFTDTRLDDDAPQSIYDGTPPFTGSFRPDTPLSVFNGESLEREWTLLVRDEVQEDSGTLNAWKVEICSGPTGILDSWALDIEVETTNNQIFLPQVVRE